MGRLSDYINGAGGGRRGTATSSVDGIKVEVNDALIDQHRRAMARLLVTDPETRKRLKAVIRKEIKNARNKTASDVRNSLENDPRSSYRAVKHAVYKSVLGGNVSILAARKAGARYMLMKARKLDENPNQRGGNRIPRSPRTEALETYFGKDRGFVLRFLNSGTEERHTRFGNRGSIAARYIFERTAPWHMDQAAEAIAKAFEEEFVAAYNEEMNQ